MTPAEMADLHAASFTMPRPWSESEIAGLLASPLVFAQTQPGALLLGRVVAGEAELLTIAVAPDQRGRGIGQALVMAFLTEAGRRGADSAFLEVAESNLAARALYAACGFRAAGRRKGYYHHLDGGEDDALILVTSTA
ncbi:MAG: GNAT family N-acetyltransferase [Rhodobacteraceae bacterium]|nr:GNAT family N-acetyltransferase [Paracoccaceae bacterium]